MEINPRAVFERLFGDGDTTDPAARLKRMKEDRSILDFVRGDVARLEPGLGARDKSKLDEYLEGIRDIERRIQKAEQQSATMKLPVMERPTAHPGRVRGTRQADERPDGDRVPDRHDPRGQLHDGARRQQPQLPLDRRFGRAPLGHAPPERSGKDREDA